MKPPTSRQCQALFESYGLTDDRGRAESKDTARTLRMCRKEFSKGRRERKYFGTPPN